MRKYFQMDSNEQSQEIASEIGLTAKDSVVRLTGVVDNYSKIIEAENTTMAVNGVKAEAEKIDIRFGDEHNKTDTDIRAKVMSAFKWNRALHYNKVEIKVEKGWATQEGNLKYHYQKQAAEDIAGKIPGVRGVVVVNDIKIISEAHYAIEKLAIGRAIERNWAAGNSEIPVKVVGNNVTLSGMVNSLYQKDEAGEMALNAPGVQSQNHQLLLGYND